MLKHLFFIFFLKYSFQLYSQNELQKKIYFEKGIMLNLEKFESSSEEIYLKISNFDFSTLRNEKTNRTIQLLNGPEIILLSFDNLLNQGLLISESIQSEKINEKTFPLIPLKTLLNIGIGETLKEELR